MTRPDWTTRSLFIGCFLSVTGLILHTTDTVPLHGLNPVAHAGCATSQSHLLDAREAKQHPASLTHKGLELVRALRSDGSKQLLMPWDNNLVIPQGPGIIVETRRKKGSRKTLREGPFPFYGLSKDGKVVVHRDAKAIPETFDPKDIVAIWLVRTGYTRKEATSGGLTMGLTGLALGALMAAGMSKNSNPEAVVGIGLLCGGVLGTMGTVGGAVTGGLKDIDDRYPIGPGHWNIR